MSLVPWTNLKLLAPRAALLYEEQLRRIACRSDRLFAGLFAIEWLAGILTAMWVSPRVWSGMISSVHVHVWGAAWYGLAIFSFPVWLIIQRPGSQLTRHAIAVAQMLWSSLFIHLTGGRIESHFHIFGSMAFLAFYRDWRVLLTATVVITFDHFVRGNLWAESIFGVQQATQWRWIEHAIWVLFEDAILIIACLQGCQEKAVISIRQSEALDRSEEQSLALSNALNDAQDLLNTLDIGTIVTMTDASGRITYANDRFCEISGYSRQELLGNDHRLVSSGLHSKSFWSEMYRTVAKGGVWRGEVRNRAKRGQFYWVDTTNCGMLDTNGKLRRIVSIRADITDRKAAEVQLAQSQRLESIGQLAAGIAHEINTPTQYVQDNVRFLQEKFGNILGVVEQSVEQLRGPDLPRETRQQAINQTLEKMDYEFVKREVPLAIEQSLEGLARITAIVRAMKEFSHPGGVEKEPVDLNHAISTTIEVCRNRWKYVATLETRLATDLPSVPCYLGEFNQVILNLIVNAADAIAERQARTDDTTPGRITVLTQQVGQNVEIRIQDDGAGIPPAVSHRIFEQFFTTKPVGKGTGQGLALSRSVVIQKHGGELFFEPATPHGTVFVIRLPMGETKAVKRNAA